MESAGGVRNEAGPGNAEDAMGVAGLAVGSARLRRSGVAMPAKFEADPISAAGQSTGSRAPGHCEDEAMQEQGMNQEAWVSRRHVCHP